MRDGCLCVGRRGPRRGDIRTPPRPGSRPRRHRPSQYPTTAPCSVRLSPILFYSPSFKFPFHSLRWSLSVVTVVVLYIRRRGGCARAVPLRSRSSGASSRSAPFHRPSIHPSPSPPPAVHIHRPYISRQKLTYLIHAYTHALCTTSQTRQLRRYRSCHHCPCRYTHHCHARLATLLYP